MGLVVAGGYGLAKGILGSGRLVKNVKSATQNFSKTSIWPSPSSAPISVNNIQYTKHALERMSPSGLIQRGTEIVSRGVPPSVVKNAIKHGLKTKGNTPSQVVHTFENVKVVTNLNGDRVITVIKVGR